MDRSSDEHRSKEARFWNWFLANEAMLFEFEQDRERIFDLLSVQLNHVHPNLTFEISPELEGLREFVISAGGISSAFPAVEALAAEAPRLPRWRVTKFRPRRNEPCVLEYEGKKVASKDVYATVLSNGRQLGLRMFLPDFLEEEVTTWKMIGYLMLDHVLGEYDVETKVGLIEFLPFDEDSKDPRVSLDELAPVFDRAFGQIKQ